MGLVTRSELRNPNYATAHREIGALPWNDFDCFSHADWVTDYQPSASFRGIEQYGVIFPSLAIYIENNPH